MFRFFSLLLLIYLNSLLCFIINLTHTVFFHLYHHYHNLSFFYVSYFLKLQTTQLTTLHLYTLKNLFPQLVHSITNENLLENQAYIFFKVDRLNPSSIQFVDLLSSS